MTSTPEAMASDSEIATPDETVSYRYLSAIAGGLSSNLEARASAKTLQLSLAGLKRALCNGSSTVGKWDRDPQQNGTIAPHPVFANSKNSKPRNAQALPA
ncbi:hypothetical protein DPSP01_011544 [Paraphaeosphaeria sporulosa]